MRIGIYVKIENSTCWGGWLVSRTPDFEALNLPNRGVSRVSRNPEMKT
jgi:hypothetical protein